MNNVGVIPGFVIAAVSSGSGKTTVANGLMRVLSRRGIRVAPFKIGPDFIDTRFHEVAAGRESINLDLFMQSEDYASGLFHRSCRGCDVAVVEGVMGLFDGYDRRKGSAANVAAMTGLPVVLVVNAASSAYSLAPLLYGFRSFDSNIEIAGVIFNNVASVRHLRLLKAAAEDAGVEMLGYLDRNPDIAVPSRHLGLSLGDGSYMRRFVDLAADAVDKTVDVDLLLRRVGINGLSCAGNEEVPARELCCAVKRYGKTRRRIAVACDEAFSFMYPENLRSLERDPRFGGEIVKFSPLRDASMPEADFLYLPGGYPELFSRRLADNTSMRESVRRFIECGGYAFAECGGMLYLGGDIDGDPMCGVLPLHTTMENARLHLGYRTLKAGDFSIKGHEFHYSSVVEDKSKIGTVISCARQFDVNGDEVATPLYRYKNTLAGYTHFYWGDGALSDFYRYL